MKGALIRQSMRAFHLPSDCYREFYARTGDMTISHVRDQFDRAMSIAEEHGTGNNAARSARPVAVQADSNQPSERWRLRRFSTLRSIETIADKLRSQLPVRIGDIDAARVAMDVVLQEADDLLGLVLDSIERQPVAGQSNDIGELDRIHTVEWPQSGDSAYVGVPDGLVYSMFNIVGAAIMGYQNATAMRSLLALSSTDKYSGDLLPLWRSKHLASHPSVFGGSAFAGWTWLTSTFAKSRSIQRHFASEYDYRVCLHAFNLLVSTASTAVDVSKDSVKILKDEMRGSMLAPTWIRARSAEFPRIWRTVGYGCIPAFVDVASTKSVLLAPAAWGTYVDWSAGFWRDSHSHLSLPRWVFARSPFA